MKTKDEKRIEREDPQELLDALMERFPLDEKKSVVEMLRS